MRQALLADLGLAAPPTATPAPPPPRPVVVARRGVLAPRSVAAIPFGLLGPRRHVTFSARVAGTTQPGTRARLEIDCERPLATRELGRAQTRATVVLRNLGPAECEARLMSTSTSAHAYTMTLTLSIG